MTRLIASAAIGAALIAPLALGSTAVAAPMSSATPSAVQESGRPFTADPVKYVMGERITVTGTAAPGATIGVNGLPGGYVQYGVAEADGTWTVTSAEVASWQIIAVLGGAYPGDGGVFQEHALVPATQVTV